MASSELQHLAKMDRNPIQETRYKELLSQEGLPYLSGGNNLSTEQFQTWYNTQAAQKAQNEAIAPAVQSLEATVPEIKSKYASERQRLESEKTPLEQRYQNLLSEITRQGNVSTSRTQTEASREFGKRGISLQSGIYDQALNQRLQPITEWLTGQTQQASTTYEDNLRQLQNLISGLVPQETADIRNIQNSIAQLKSGASQNAIQQALAMQQWQSQQELAKREMALKEMMAQQQTPEMPSYLTLSQGQVVIDPTTGQLIYNNPKTYAPSGGSSGSNNQLELLRQIFS